MAGLASLGSADQPGVLMLRSAPLACEAMTTGVYPGSFNPPTVAHLAIAEAAVEQCGLERLDLLISIDALGKSTDELLPVDRRLAALERAAATRPWLRTGTTDRRLIADIAQGYDVIVLGADKWLQVIDPAWYGGSADARDRALARLPRIALAPRAGIDLPDPATSSGADAIGEIEIVVLDLHEDHHAVSASAVRDGRTEWVVPEATDLLDDL